MELNIKLANISGIGPTYAKRLERLNLFTIEDLIYHYPFRYDDFSKISKISEVKIGECITLSGEIWTIKNTYTRFRKVLTKATLNDGTGSIEITWFNQSWLVKNIKVGDKIRVSGKIDRFNYKTTLISPEWEKAESNIHTGRLVPIYPETYGISSKWLRLKMSKALPSVSPNLEDPLPDFIKNNMLPLKQALQGIHFPQNWQGVYQAKYRLSFDELFYIQLQNQKTKTAWQEKRLVQPLNINLDQLEKFIKNLPFELTKSQATVIQEIVTDLKKQYPMNRLVQGEVGSGKTVVAAAIIYLVHLNKQKSLLMAPTEILAFQHFATLSKLLEPFGITVGIYTGSKKFTKPQVLLRGASATKQSDRLSNGITSPSARNDKLELSTPDVIVGTHALLSKSLEVDNVGLIVIDEQQRFGVEQRSILRNKAKSPHFLTMTATPIPRTVALTLYGDLDLSIIDELPKGRKLVKTHYVPGIKREDAYKFIFKQVKSGFQVYIVTPLIEESETMLSAKAAKVEFERLQKKVFPDLKLGLLHGKLKSKEKEEVINNFKDHKIDILVSTSVVEVGVDIPNATIMVIEGAERFGLAQLHQLRGRVGRGEAQSYTFLFTEEENPQAVGRVKNLERIYDGLKLAELDLKIRGGGEIFGMRQSGRWNLKIADFSDLKLIEETKEAAAKLLKISPTLDKYPLLAAKLSDQGTQVMPD